MTDSAANIPAETAVVSLRTVRGINTITEAPPILQELWQSAEFDLEEMRGGHEL